MSIDQSSQNWSSAEVCSWLSSVGHADLVCEFRRLNVTGRDLPNVTDEYLRTQVGVSDGQKRKLVSDALCSLRGRGASGNGEAGRDPSIAAKLKRSQTLPANLGADPDGRRPSNLGSEPMLGISAQELMLDGCSNCGWIRKEGGNVRNCELHLVCPMSSKGNDKMNGLQGCVVENLSLLLSMNFLSHLPACVVLTDAASARIIDGAPPQSVVPALVRSLPKLLHSEQKAPHVLFVMIVVVNNHGPMVWQ